MSYFGSYLSQAFSSLTADDEPSTLPPVESDTKLTDEAAADKPTESTAAWLKNMYSNKHEVWKKIKGDLGELACSIEPKKQLVEETASKMAHTLGDSTEYTAEMTSKMLASLGSGLTHLGSIGNNYLHTYLLPPTQDDTGEETLVLDQATIEGISASCESKDIKIQILRADPKTYSTEPKAPDGVTISFVDWFNAYFDEIKCQPRPGVPLNVSDTLAPVHDSPEKILNSCPAVKNHLNRLVNPELGLKPSPDVTRLGISEVDFWSRYYYRVWCLEILEERRRRVKDRALRCKGLVVDTSNITPSNAGSVADKTSSIAWDVSEDEEENEVKDENRSKKSEQTEFSTPEVLTMKSESPVLLSSADEARDPDETCTWSRTQSSVASGIDETVSNHASTLSAMPASDEPQEPIETPTRTSDEPVEEDDWESWS